MVKFDDEPTAISNTAKYPRLVEKVQEYKCTCMDIYGSRCPECQGEDPECEVCDCDCLSRPHKLSEFKGVSKKCQAYSLGLIDEDRKRTVVVY